jgi:hypothetical protein
MHLPTNSTKWFSDTSRLAGTFEKGVQGIDDAEWAVKFDTLTYNSFLFATGNFNEWIIGPKASIAISSTARKTVTSSSISSNPYDKEIYVRGSLYGPTIWVEDIPYAYDNARILYKDKYQSM